MNLNHINLGVTDVPATVAMFETYFGLVRPEGMPLTPKMAFLIDDAGSLVSLFKVPDATYPKIFHIGFTRPTAAEVVGDSGEAGGGRVRAGGCAGRARAVHVLLQGAGRVHG